MVLSLLIAIGALLALTAVTAILAFQPPDPEKKKQQALAQQKAGQYESAIINQYAAAEVSRKPEDFLLLGEMILERREKDP